MPHEFEVTEEITLDATPEEVWEAIATGPGVDSWWMGRNEIEPRLGGATTSTMIGEVGHGTVTAWEPLKHFAYRTAEQEGTFMAFEFLLEGRAGGSTVLRFVHNGFLGDDDWDWQYDALREGDRKYLEKLAVYVAHFAGRASAYNLFLPGPQVGDADRVWDAFTAAYGLSADAAAGDTAHLAVGPGAGPGVVEHADRPGWLIVRTADAIHMMIYARSTVVVEAHCFDPATDPEAVNAAWTSWLETAFA